MDGIPKRLLRRNHYQRLKAQAVKRRKMWGFGDPEAFAGFYANTQAPCSCWMCANPRKIWGDKTFQEIKNDMVVQEWESSAA